VDDHLATCLECREELASLAGLPAMLRKVPIVEAERLAAPEQDPDLAGVPSAKMLPSLVARTANVRRIRRWRTIATAAAVAILALGGGAAVASSLQPSRPPVAALHWHTAGGGAGAVHLTVMYRPVESGTVAKANVTGAPPGSVCQLLATDGHGHVSVLGSWQFWSRSEWYPASTWMSITSVRSFELTIGGKVVASAPA
jgi:anti-sigma-K factor RskA